MSNSSPVIVDKPHLGDELACYLQSDALDIVLPNVQAPKTWFSSPLFYGRFS